MTHVNDQGMDFKTGFLLTAVRAQLEGIGELWNI